MGSFQKEARLKVAARADIEKISSGVAVAPHVIKTGEVGEATEGWLVELAGKVSETSGDVFYVDDGSGAAKVVIKATTDIDKPRMKKGDVVTVTGVVSQTVAGFRVLPRFIEDIRLGSVAGLTRFPATGVSLGWLLVLIGLVGYLAYSSWRHREPFLFAGERTHST
jgi:hypothetical protein